jgi:hypothetical protein
MNPLNYATLEASQRLHVGHGLFAILDAEDFDRLSRYTYHAVKRKGHNTIYAERSEWEGRKGHTFPNRVNQGHSQTK